jgi:putative membrane-bound dehydrogenase-like protein
MNINNNKTIRRLGAALLVLLLILPFSRVMAAQDAGTINLLFIGHDQREGSGYHLSHLFAPLFNQSLGREKIRMEYQEDLQLLTAEGLARFDAVMLYANYDQLTKEQETSLLNYVENGGAFLPVHSASACFGHSDAFVKLVGGRFHSHGLETFTTRIATGQENHPILHGYKGFETRDETYVHRDHNEQGRTVLMLREDEPWTWVREQGKGRVFYTAYGHDQTTWGQPAFHDLLIRGILWGVGDEKRKANRALAASLPQAKYEDRGTIPNYRRVDPKPQYQFPMNVKDSMALSMVEQGFELQFFVGEPDIVNPVAFTWDERGRLFVVESIDYPNDLRANSKGNDRVTMCEDTTGDGRADKCTPFAEGLNIPTGIVAVNGGFIVAQAPDFLFLKDTNGDGKADLRQVLNSVWGTDDTHAGPSNLRYGHDNRIWGAVGYSGVKSESQGEFQNGVYRMNPDGSNIEPIGQFSNNTWGLGISEDFEIFGSTANNAPAFHVPLWRSHVFGKHEELAPRMAARIDEFTQVFPITHNFLQVDAHGRYTAGSGFNLYTARAFPEHFWNSGAFIGEPTAHLLGQFFIEPKGVTYTAKNRGSLLSSADEWLSPVYADVGPDGQLWIADWYNFIIQHNPIPTKASAGFDAKSGEGNAHVNPLRDGKHGRIYRLVAAKAPAYTPLDLSQADTPRLVQTLANDNLFWRITAQRKLVQEKRLEAVPALRAILTGKPNLDAIGLDVNAIHAIWTLQGLGAFSMDHKADRASIRRALAHSSPATRKNAVRALIESGTAADLKTVAALIDDADDKIRIQALVAISKQPASKAAAQTLLRMRTQITTDPWLTQAFLLASLSQADHYWRELTRGKPKLAGSFLQGFDKPEQTPEYLMAKRYLAKAPNDLTRTLASWKGLSDGRLPLMTMAAVEAWRDRRRQPNDSELKNLQALIDKIDSEAQMAIKLRASGLVLNFSKVDEEAYAKYHAQHAFTAHVWGWGQPEHGKTLYQQHCASCHGGDGGGDQALGAPTLAGMDNWYVQTQLQKFLAGLRGTHFKDPDGMSMRAALDFLQVELDPNRDSSHLGHFLVTLPKVAQPATVTGDATRGAAHYTACAACHGADGKGNSELRAPRLAGQADWYLVKQLEKYRSGARGADPRDSDGQQMATFAKMLADEQALKDVVTYIRGLKE